MRGILAGMVFFWIAAGAWAATEGTLAPGFVNPGYEEQPSWFKESFLDIREDVAEAAARGRRVLLYFYQDGCPYCAKLLRVNFADRGIVEKTRAGFDVIAVNMWGDREVTDLAGRQVTEKDFAKALRVQFTPTLLFLDEEGRTALRVNGYYRPHKFSAALDYGAGRHRKGESFRDYLARVDSPPAMGRLHQDPAYLQPPYRLARRSAGRPLLVLFEQGDCRPCDELHQEVFQQAATRALLAGFDVVLLDRWADTPVQTPDGRQTTAKAWARRLDLQFAPSMVFFDGTGREVFRTDAYLRSFHVQSALDYVVSGAYRDEPEFQRFVQTRAEALRERGIPVDLWK